MRHPPPHQHVRPLREGCPELTSGTFLGRKRLHLGKLFERFSVEAITPSRLSGKSVKFNVYLSRIEDAPLRTLFKTTHRSFVFAKHRSEIATYRLSRLLFMDSVPPAALAKLSSDYLHKLLIKHDMLEQADLFKKEVFRSEDIIDGALIFYVEGAQEFQLSFATLKSIGDTKSTTSPAQIERARQLSDMLFLDFLTNNYDRFSGGNILQKGDRLLLIDNGAAFGPERPWKRAWRYQTLRYLQRLRRSTWEALMALTKEDLATCLGEFLSTKEQQALLERRTELLMHIETLKLRSGDRVFLP